MSSIRAWRETRPTSAPSEPLPPPESHVVAVAKATDGSAEVRIVRRAGGRYSFEIVAWTNFEDAGGTAHHRWNTFQPEFALVTDSFTAAVEAAQEDARARMLFIGPITRIGGDA
jgi:hypothetical protein